MKKTTIVAAALAMAVAAAPISTHASRVGAPAPDFKGTDSKGKVHNLSDFRGKWVVLRVAQPGLPVPSGSTTAAATCRNCRRSGRRKASRGSPSSRLPRASRDT